MKREHLRYLACPQCSESFDLTNSVEDSLGIRSAELTCVGCQSTFPIVRHIPRFVPERNYASSFGFQWTKHAQTQHDSYTGVAISEERFFQETRWPRLLAGEVVLEVGC